MTHTRNLTILMLVTTSAGGILAADDKAGIAAEGVRATGKSEPAFSNAFPFSLWPENKKGQVVRSFGFGFASTELLPQYAKALRSKKVGDITLSLTCLGSLGQHAESAIPAILSTLEHPSLEVRVAALECCGRIGISDPKMLDKVKPMLASDDKRQKLAAIFCICRLETPKYEHYREALQIWSSDNDEQTNRAAYSALLRSKHIWFRFLVADALLAADPTIRATALHLLEGTRSPVQRVIACAVMWRSLSDGNSHVRAGAAYCLATNSIMPRFEILALSAIRRSSSSDLVRQSAVRGILLYENQLPKTTYREVVLALADNSQDVRDQAKMISNVINRKRSILGDQLVAPLVDLLSDARSEVRQTAIGLLGWCKSAAGNAIPSVLCILLFDEDRGVREAAFKAIQDIVSDCL